MAKRLIDLGKLIDSLKGTQVDKYYPEWNDMTPLGKAAVLRTIRAYREIVLKQPTVDAVEVVRCRDCKHHRTFHGRDMCARNAKLLDGHEVGLCATGADDFCSYGERKEA